MIRTEQILVRKEATVMRKNKHGEFFCFWGH